MVYLLHFNEPFRHAKHYTGYARDEATFARRIEHHRKGSGARLTAAATAAGVTFTVARVWPEGDRDKERRLKTSGGASRYCPICRACHSEPEQKQQRKAA